MNKICHRSGKIVSADFQCKNCQCAKKTKHKKDEDSILDIHHWLPYLVSGAILLFIWYMVQEMKEKAVQQALNAKETHKNILPFTH